jgi:hypothetical protein
MRDKTVQVKLTNKLSSTAIKSSCIDTIQSAIESLDNLLSYAYLSVAIVLLVHKLWINLFKTAEHLNSFVLHCIGHLCSAYQTKGCPGDGRRVGSKSNRLSGYLLTAEEGHYQGYQTCTGPAGSSCCRSRHQHCHRTLTDCQGRAEETSSDTRHHQCQYGLGYPYATSICTCCSVCCKM